MDKPGFVDEAGVDCTDGRNELKTEVKNEEMFDNSSSNEMCEVNLPISSNKIDSLSDDFTLDDADAVLNIVPHSENFGFHNDYEIKIEDNDVNDINEGDTNDVLLENKSHDINNKQVCITYIIFETIALPSKNPKNERCPPHKCW